MKTTDAYLHNEGMGCGAVWIGALRGTVDMSASLRRSTRGRCEVTSDGKGNGTGAFVRVYDERTDKTVSVLGLGETIGLATAAYTVDSPTQRLEYPLYGPCKDRARYARLT